MPYEINCEGYRGNKKKSILAYAKRGVASRPARDDFGMSDARLNFPVLELRVALTGTNYERLVK